jgi:hypothetical protein
MATVEVKFSDTCRTIALKQEKIFISALPGSIILGEVCPTGFKHQHIFKFNHFQFFELYLAIISIIKFQLSENKSEKGLILKLNNETLYYWNGLSVEIDRKESKIVKFVIEFQFENIYEIIFNDQQLNNLIGAISQMILPSLCLNEIERTLFQFATEQDISFLVTLNNLKACEKFVTFFQTTKKIKIDPILEPNFVQNLIYYNEIIIINHKFQSIYNSEFEFHERIEKILDQ